jgi:hypothetical protein
VVCSGDNINCAHCSGSGRVPVLRCPWAILEESDTLAVELALLFLEQGVLPEEGALLDQSAVFYDCWRLVSGVRAEVHEREMERVRNKK